MIVSSTPSIPTIFKVNALEEPSHLHMRMNSIGTEKKAAKVPIFFFMKDKVKITSNLSSIISKKNKPS